MSSVIADIEDAPTGYVRAMGKPSAPISLQRGFVDFIFHVMPTARVLPRGPTTNKSNCEARSSSFDETTGGLSGFSWLGVSPRTEHSRRLWQYAAVGYTLHGFCGTQPRVDGDPSQ